MRRLVWISGDLLKDLNNLRQPGEHIDDTIRRMIQDAMIFKSISEGKSF